MHEPPPHEQRTESQEEQRLPQLELLSVSPATSSESLICRIMALGAGSWVLRWGAATRTSEEERRRNHFEARTEVANLPEVDVEACCDSNTIKKKVNGDNSLCVTEKDAIRSPPQ
jgi:hypothetical protein